MLLIVGRTLSAITAGRVTHMDVGNAAVVYHSQAQCNGGRPFGAGLCRDVAVCC
jgi:hypothetical protein